MSTTIDSLDIQISTSAGQASRQIHDLAIALGRLKENGKITGATTGLKKLAGALNELNPALNSMNAAKLQQLRGAMSGLANIQKLTGLNSAVNTLKKLPDVVAGLDATDLTRFKLQMERLSDALGPLANRLDRISKGFSKLPNYLGKAVTVTNRMARETEKAAAATEKHSKALNAQSLNVMSAISNFESFVHVVQMVGGAIEATMAQAMEWDGIQYRFGRAFGEDAEEVYAYAQKINDVLGINMQQFMQYSSLYGSLLSGFGLAQEKVTTISVGLTELSYDIWAAYNDRFKNLEDASEAVRSAITGEIEPIRNAGIALTEASLQEYLEQVGMAHISIEKLSEAQKAEVRYAAMMNAAMNQGIVGTYAAEMQTAEGAVRSLSQSFKTLVQAFGSLFIPLLQIAIPYLTAFVNLLTEAVHWIAELFGISMFEIDWGNDLSSGLGGAADGAESIESAMGGAADAAKKIKNYTMGFDELNVIQPPTDSGSGSGGAGGSGVDWGSGLDLETMWDNSVFEKASQQVNELKQKIKGWFEEWKTQIAIVGAAMGALSLTSLLTSLGEALGLGDKFLGVLGTIKKFASTAIVVTLQYSLMSEFLGNFIEEGSWKDYILAMVTAAIGTGILYSMWGPTGIVIGLGVTAVASFGAVFENGGITNAESATTALTGLASAIGAIWLAWKKLAPAIMESKLVTGIQALLGTLKGPQTIFDSLKGGNAASSALTFISPGLSQAIGTFTGAAKAVGAFLAGISAPVWGAFAGVVIGIASAVTFLYRNWEEVTAAAKRFFDENIAPKLDSIMESFKKIGKALGPVGEAIGTAFKGLMDLVSSSGLLDGLGAVFEWIGGIVVGVFGGAIAGAFQAAVGVIEGFIQIVTGIVEIVSGVVDAIVKLCTGDLSGAGEAVERIGQGIADVFGGLYKATIGAVIDFVEGVIDWCLYLWDELVGHSIIPDTVDGIIKCFVDLPGDVFRAVESFVSGVLTRVKGLWDDLKSWFSSNVAPKLTLTYWKDKFNNIAAGLRSKWDEARTWWNNNKPTLATVQAAIASIKDALSNAWTAARNWWSNKTGLSSISFSIESIKSKIESAWKTARDWLANQTMKLNIKTPHFSVGWNYDIPAWQAAITEFLFDKRAMPFLDVQWYAQGGYPDMGEFFVAREHGPELVGRIGGRSAVANNDQIVEAVSQGVYSAVVEAMRGSGGQSAQAINIYLDGKQITAAVEKHQRERGATLMTGGMAYGY